MRANIVCLTAIFGFLCYLGKTEADVDCSKPPPHAPFEMCCQTPDYDKEVKEACAEFAGPPMPPPPMTSDGNMPPPPPMPRHGHPPHPHGKHGPNACLAECLFNQTEIMDANGDLNQDKYDAITAAVITDDEELLTTVREAFATCAEKISAIKDEMTEKFNEHMEKIGAKSSCSPFAAMVYHCTLKQVYRNCPTSVWNDTDECNANRDFLTECVGNEKE